MPLRPIVRLGHPALRGVATALAPERVGEAAVQELIDDLVETMRAARGVGLAAPQVGVSVQVFVYELAGAPRTSDSEVLSQGAGTSYGSAGAPSGPPLEPPPAAQDPERSGVPERQAAGVIPLHVVINPMLTPQAGELVYDWEGCLSIPDLRGLVPRHPAVRVRGLDRGGRPLDYVASGFEARIVQHEFDHLNGIVFLDRMRDLKALAFREEWERYMAAGAAEPFDPPALPPPASPPPSSPPSPPSPPPPREAAEPASAGARPAIPEVI
jgi:peptide deformylase